MFWYGLMLRSKSIWGSHWLAGMLLNTTAKIWTMPNNGKQSWNISYSFAVEHNLPEHVARGAGPGSVFHSLEQERQSDVLQLSSTFKNHQKSNIIWIFSRSYVEGVELFDFKYFQIPLNEAKKGFARQWFYGSSMDHFGRCRVST